MTLELKDKIRSLRLSGVGYGNIAKQLNIPEDTVKTHRKRGMATLREKMSDDMLLLLTILMA